MKKSLSNFIKRNKWQTIIILFGSFLIYQDHQILGAAFIGIGFGTLD
jgi:hypothetical protein